MIQVKGLNMGIFENIGGLNLDSLNSLCGSIFN